MIKKMNTRKVISFLLGAVSVVSLYTTFNCVSKIGKERTIIEEGLDRKIEKSEIESLILDGMN